MLDSIAFAMLLLAQQPSMTDGLTEVVTLRTDGTNYFAPIHATVMPDGRVALMGYSKPSPVIPDSGTPVAGIFTPTPWNQLPPASVTIPRGNNAFDVPYYENGQVIVRDSLFCSGHTLLADGRLVTVGGTRYVTDKQTGVLYLLGLPYSILFNGTTWSRGPSHVGTAALQYPYRWYSTATRLASGKVIATSGYDLAEAILNGEIIPGSQLRNRSIEELDPSTGSWSLLATHEEAPDEIFNYDYTHVFQMPRDVTPGKDVLMFGNPGVPVLFSPTSAPRFTVRSGAYRPGSGGISGHGVSSALLPLRLADREWGYSNGSVVMAGGSHGTAYEHGLDVYDPMADGWLPRTELAVRRHHPMLTTLPDGRVLISAGHDDQFPSNPEVRHAQLYDPDTRILYRGSSESVESRGYHAVSVLLPDGRVMLAGGRDGGSDSPELEKSSLRYYYPWYFAFQPYRPVITSGPAQLDFGSSATITYTTTFPVTEAVLIGLGTFTHSIDMSQRHVQIAVSIEGANASITAPADPKIAPPGYYMLFLLDQYRIPSAEGKIVHLGP